MFFADNVLQIFFYSFPTSNNKVPGKSLESGLGAVLWSSSLAYFFSSFLSFHVMPIEEKSKSGLYISPLFAILLVAAYVVFAVYHYVKTNSSLPSFIYGVRGQGGKAQA